MSIELLPGTTNVVRFPVELRMSPSIDVVYEIEPDVRDVMRAADSLSFELPERDLRERVDAETARFIAEHILPLAPDERRPALEELLRPVMATAVEACRRAAQVGQRSLEAQRRLTHAGAEGGSWMEPLERNADGLLREAAELLILSHRRCQEAHGVNRAVGIARRGEAWTPDSQEDVATWLVAAGEADRARRASVMA